MKLFEYAIICHPTEDDRKLGKRSELVVDVTRILARDYQEVTILASRAIPEEYMDRLGQLEVAVRPF